MNKEFNIVCDNEIDKYSCMKILRELNIKHESSGYGNKYYIACWGVTPEQEKEYNKAVQSIFCW